MAKATSATSTELDPRRQVTLDQYLGNEPIVGYLRRAWNDATLPQVLLYAGPPGIGKTTLAYALAREIMAQGEDPATERHAQKVGRGTHPDVMEINGQGRASGQIPVDDVREMESRVGLMPLEGPRKIVIIRPADALNLASANALLKLLEEPPRFTLLMLTTIDPNRLLPTIRSRCSVQELRPVPVEALQAWLAGRVQLDPTRVRLAATLAEGRPGYALELASGGLLEQRGEVLKWLAQLGQEGFASLFAVADQFAAGDLVSAFRTALLLLRDVLAIQMTGPDARPPILNIDLEPQLRALGSQRTPAGVLAAAEAFARGAAEAPWFYGGQARQLWAEQVLVEVGSSLKRN